MLKKFIKLLKYEFKFYFRIMPFFYLGVIILAVITGAGNEESLFLGLDRAFDFRYTSAFFLVIVTTVMLCVNVALIVRRFRENLLSDTGYLMMTLPVNAVSLTGSKTVAAFCTSLLSMLTGLVSFVLILLLRKEIALSELSALFTNHEEMLSRIIVYGTAGVLHAICLIYAALTASRLLPKFRTPAAFIAYGVMATVIEGPLFRGIQANRDGVSPEFVGAFLVLAGVYFWLTGFLLKRTLNLD